MRLLGGLAALAIAASWTPAWSAPVTLTVHRIESFGFGGAQPDGPLDFLGGLQISSDHPQFGGFSGVSLLGDGSQMLAINDSGSFLRARLMHNGGRLVGAAEGELEELFGDGTESKQRGDTEDIAFDPRDPSKGVIVRERQANAMLAFDLENGRPVRFNPTVVGAANRTLRSNAGLESVAFAPASSTLAGNIIAIAERPPRGETDIPGWIAGVGAFSIVRHDEFDVSSARFLPDGDLLLLERRFSPARGIGMRLRRIAGDAITVGARLDGDYILDAGMTSQIDNMEGLEVSRDAEGRTILTIVSDDNYNIFQRTLILQFALRDR